MGDQHRNDASRGSLQGQPPDAEYSLMAEESVKRLLLESSLLAHLSDIVSIIDADLRFLYVSRTAGERTLADVLGTCVLDHIPPSSRGAFHEAFGRAWASGEPVTVEAASDDGQYWWENRLVRVTDEHGRSVMFTTTCDITPRKRAEQALRESEGRMRDAMAASGIGTFIWDPTRDLVAWDEGTCRIFGVDPQHTPTNLAGYVDFLHPEDRPRVEQHVAHALRTGEYPDLEHRLLRTNGEVRHLFLRGSTSRDAQGKVNLVRGGVLDVTDRKRLEEQLRQAHKMEAIGQLTAGVAHNFNNLLSIVLPNVELCRESVPDDAKIYLDDIEHAALRASELVRQLMLAARREGSLAKVPCELVAVVERTLHICRSTFDRAIDIRCQLELREVTIQARPGEIEQVLLNICINARDALQQAGTKEPRITLRLENGAEGMVQISITDNGPGVTPEVRSHLFEPFFTTKGVGRGTGLGLATAYGILGDHGGRITCDSQLGGPTTFRVELPRLNKRVQRQVAPSQPAPVTGTETILVIDDEPMVRRALRGVLESGGFRVLEAADGQDGLDLLAADKNIALVVLDRSMPRMSGETFLQELNRTGHKLPVVLLTGDPGQEALTASAVMLKPPRAAPLLSTVRNLLDQLRAR